MTTRLLMTTENAKRSFPRPRALLLGLCVITALGCTWTSIRSIPPPRQETPPPSAHSLSGTPMRLAKPERLLVHDFAVAAEDVALDRAVGAQLLQRLQGTSQSEGQLEVGRATAQALSVELVKAIQKLGFAADRAAGAPPTGNVLVSEGQFVSIDEGNRLRRMVIGLGAGATEVKTQVQVYAVTPTGRKLVQEFETTAQSSRKPGMAETMGAGAAIRGAQAVAVGAGVGVVSEYGETVEADARRTAQAVADKLKPFFINEGWIAEEMQK